MPCRDYMDDFPNSQVPDLKARCDMLSRIACKALEHIEQSADGLEVLILKDPEIQKWWREHKEADRRAKAAAVAKERAMREKERLEKIREDTISKLTTDQIKALGIKVK